MTTEKPITVELQKIPLETPKESPYPIIKKLTEKTGKIDAKIDDLEEKINRERYSFELFFTDIKRLKVKKYCLNLLKSAIQSLTKTCESTTPSPSSHDFANLVVDCFFAVHRIAYSYPITIESSTSYMKDRGRTGKHIIRPIYDTLYIAVKSMAVQKKADAVSLLLSKTKSIEHCMDLLPKCLIAASLRINYARHGSLPSTDDLTKKEFAEWIKPQLCLAIDHALREKSNAIDKFNSLKNILYHDDGKETAAALLLKTHRISHASCKKPPRSFRKYTRKLSTLEKQCAP